MVIIISVTTGTAQEYFNYRYNISGEWLYDYATTVLTTNNGYLIGAESGSTDNPNRRRIALMNIDFLGQMTDVKFFGETGISYGVGYPGFLIKTEDPGYALTGFKRSPYPGWIRDQGILFRLDENYDTLWTRLYGDMVEPCDTELILRQVRQLHDGGFILFGGPMDYNDQRPHFSIIRTDSNGNKVWEKFYGDPPFHYYAYHFSVTSDKGFILGGLRWYDGSQSYDPVIFKTDSVGNEEWFMNLGSIFKDYAAFTDTTFDGKIIIGTIIADSALGFDNYYGRICFSKIDNEGNIIWQKKYGANYISDQLWSIKSLSNGSIVATGSGYRQLPGSGGPKPRIGWIICTDYKGDSLWCREYSLLQGEYSKNFLYDITQTYDSGFIACGYVSPVYPDTGTQDTWVIKVDSIGCESLEYCWTGIENPEINPVDKGKFIAFPNPAINHIEFTIEGETILSGSHISIYNIYGRETAHEIIPHDVDSWQVNVSLWPPGIYVARMVFMNVVVGSVKFIIN